MAAAQVELQRDFNGLKDHLRSYEVVVDGEVIGQIRPGESQTWEVNPGAHELFLKISWCRSEKRTIVAEAGRTVAFRCAPNGSLFTDFYWVSFGRHRYIELTEIGS